MTDKLSVFNKTLLLLIERPLVNLSINCEQKRVLDSQWDDVVGYCLAQGLWRFAKRAVSIDASTTVAPEFGYLNAFTIPNDWVRTVTSSANPQLDPPLLDVREEAGYWYANCTPLYVSYVSSDPLYGLNLGAWPANFTDYAALGLPGKDTEVLEGIKRDEKVAKRNAKGSDAMNDPPGVAPMSMLARSRLGGIGFGRGGGSRENG
jgi:hypothetical protein